MDGVCDLEGHHQPTPTLVGKTIYHVKNMVQFIKQLRELRMQDDEIMNCYDVVRLSTNVPIDKTMSVMGE